MKPKPKPKPKPQLVKKSPVVERRIPVTDQHTQEHKPQEQHQAQKKDEEQKQDAPAIDPKLPPNVKVHLPVPPPAEEAKAEKAKEEKTEPAKK